jgi:hypothetical protein
MEVTETSNLRAAQLSIGVGKLGVMSGWKDITHYSRKGVHTVQRYEWNWGFRIRLSRWGI